MEYRIPLFDLNFDGDEEKAVLETLRDGWISTGPRCAEFESTFAEMLDAKFAISLSNCTSALHLAMLALGIGEGDEVICPSLTFAASANAIRYVGATPVFADITGPDDINIDPDEIESKVTAATKAIVVVHMAGFACDMERIMKFADERGIRVVEDACHGPLSEYDGKKLGTIGDIGCFSFFSNKNISTGEGGMLVTNDESINDRVRLMRSHGMTTMSYQRAKGHATSYDVVELGYNFRMDDIRASIGLAQLNKLEADLIKRKTVRDWYLESLKSIEGIHVPFIDREEFSSNYILPIVLADADVEKRDSVREELHSAGVQTSVHYPAVHRFSIYEDYSASLPNTEYVSDCELTLPMYGRLTKDDVDFVCSSLRNALDA